MVNRTSTKILDRTSFSIPVKIKSDGTIILPKSWVKDILNCPALATKINDVLVITPREAQPNYSIDEESWRKIRPTLRKIRRQLFKEKYPQLYAFLKKRRNA